ncbi:MAG: multidrug effflux MFS transporter [Acidobacteria bacterium]|nr:multidrug effflux MFS transporter [Acidobacteriota bacterium]MBI3425300.1 multidrug effflux MFS transporter [Acidobacteriota bacterium]
MNKVSWRLVSILGALTAFGSLSIDMYLPSFPTLEKELRASGSAVQFSLAAFFIGLALGQAFYGPLADRFGRKRPLYFGVALYVVASVGCALAPNIESLIAWRFVQAVGGCAGIVIARAMVRDLFDHHSSAKVFSLLVLVLGVAPILAPVLGGYVLKAYGWRAIFVILAVFGVGCLLAAIFGLQETLPEAARHTHDNPIRTAVRVYGQLLVDRRFNGYALAGAVAQAGLFAYISNSPFVFIQFYGVPEQVFGILFGVNAFGLIAASQINHRLLARWKPDEILHWVVLLIACFGLVMLLMAWTRLGGMWTVWPPLFAFVSALGFSFPNMIAGAMAHQAERAGSASALVGTLQFGAATLAGSLVGVFHNASAVPMAAVIAGCGCLALLLHRIMIQPLVRELGQVEVEEEVDLQIVD